MAVSISILNSQPIFYYLVLVIYSMCQITSYSFRNKVDAKVLLELFDIFIWELLFGKIL